MKISVTDYAQALYELVQDKPEVAKQSISRFVSVLKAQGKSKLLPSILNELSRVESRLQGRLDVTVTVPSALSSQQRDELEKALQSADKTVKTVTINEVVDPTVLGGIKVKVGDIVIDHTVQTKLNTLAAKL